MALLNGYGRETIRENIRRLVVNEKKATNVAIAIAHSMARASYWQRHPHGFLPAYIYPDKGGRRDAPKDRVKTNPATRDSAEAAARLAEKFHGRAPTDEFVYDKPKIPDAMANIGKVFAIEYLAERDGREYRFRHVFKQKARPQLAVSPDGSFVALLGGAWRFTEDGFEDGA